jgi:hypothetical protein
MNDTNSQVDDILTNDLSGVDTRNPVLPKGRYAFKVKKIELKVNETKSPPTRGLNIQLQLNQTATSEDGQALQPGVVFFDYVHLTPSGGLTADNIKKSLKRIQEAVGVNGAFYPLEQYEGRDVQVDTTVEDAEGDYPRRNRFRWVKKD